MSTIRDLPSADDVLPTTLYRCPQVSVHLRSAASKALANNFPVLEAQNWGKCVKNGDASLEIVEAKNDTHRPQLIESVPREAVKLHAANAWFHGIYSTRPFKL